MTYLVYDVVIVAILLFFVLRGSRKGLILSLCSLAAIFVAIIGARVATTVFAPQVSNAIQPHFSVVIEEQLGNGLEETLDNLLNSDEHADNFIVNILTTLGFYDEVSEAIRNAISDDATQTVTNVATSLARTVAELVANVLVFVVAFLIITVLWFLLSHTLNFAARLPVLHGLNRTLGGLFGLLQGMLLLFLITWVLRLLGGIIPQETISQTTLLKFFCNTNLLSTITGI